MIPPLDLQTTENEGIEKLQANLKRFVTALENCPIIDGNLVENIFIPGVIGNFTFNHGLGRLARGLIFTDHTYYTEHRVVSKTDKSITIFWPHTTDSTVDIWVF